MEKAVCFAVGKISTKLDEFYKNRDVCQETQTPYFFITGLISDKVKSVFELEAKRYETKSPIPVSVDSLEGYEILLRSWVQYSRVALKKISQMNGINVVTPEDLDCCDNWPLVVQERFTKRKIGVVSAGELEGIAQNFSIAGNVFVKKLFKDYQGYGIVATLEEVKSTLKHGLPYLKGTELNQDNKGDLPVNPDTKVILSEPVAFEHESYGNLEYRIWVVNNSVVGITRYINPWDDSVPESVRRFADNFLDAHKNKLPSYYTFDVGITSDRGEVLVEVNAFPCAGGATRDLFRKILETYKGASIAA